MTLEPDAHTAMIRRRMAATQEELFDAWTDAEGMRAWMCPGDIVSVDVSMDLRIGGSLSVIMRDVKRTYEHHGEFTIIDRPTKLAFTWTAAATDLQPTLVTVELFKVTESETELVLTHAKFPRPNAADQYRGGWDQIAAKLERYLAGRR